MDGRSFFSLRAGLECIGVDLSLSIPSWSQEYVILNSGPLISVFIEEDSHEIGGELDFPHIFIN